MKLSREQARDVRSGRAWAMRTAGAPASSGPSPATTYPELTRRLAELRAALASDPRRSRSVADTRRGHEDLERALTQAIAVAFSADAHGAATPEGITSWVSEGLARSYEREIAIFAAMDASGSPDA